MSRRRLCAEARTAQEIEREQRAWRQLDEFIDLWLGERPEEDT